MFEVLAAAVGAALTAVGISVATLKQQNQQGRDSLVRLAAAVDNLSRQLDVLHTDMRSVNQEVFKRLSTLEQATARMEGQGKRP